MHTHSEKFHFIRSPREHLAPPRFFVTCSLCGVELQAVKRVDGTIHAFTTNRKRTDKRVYSFRLTENGAAKVRAMQKKGLLK